MFVVMFPMLYVNYNKLVRVKCVAVWRLINYAIKKFASLFVNEKTKR